MKKSILFVFVIFVNCLLYAQDQQSSSLLDPNQNDQLEILNMRKLDLRPGDVISRTDNQYVLGDSNYRWKNIVSSSGTINYFTVGTIAFPDGTVQTSTVSSGGKILQSSQTFLTSAFGTTNSVFQATGLKASITPRFSTSKIKVSVTGTLFNASVSSTAGLLTIKRDSTDLSGSFFVRNGNGSGARDSAFGITYYDSPATTSAITYEVYIRSTDGATDVELNVGSGKAVLILEEIGQ